MAGRGNGLGQRNVARMKAPLDSEQMAALAALPDPINLVVNWPVWETANRTPAGRSR